MLIETNIRQAIEATDTRFLRATPFFENACFTIRGVIETTIVITTLGGVARRVPTADRNLGKYVPLMATSWRNVFSKVAPRALIAVNPRKICAPYGNQLA